MTPIALAFSSFANPVTAEVASSAPGVATLYGATAALLLVVGLVLREVLVVYAAGQRERGTLKAEAADHVSTAAHIALVPLAAVFLVAFALQVLETL
ncbi:MAG TPA: hypothetical protein VM889_02090 [Candidatus Thermoplasmatota archaeon]|nr:hypothetical protein [Candidatus Thermoplasmatota archaeon]